MRLTAYTDYSLRVLIFLGLHTNRLSTIQEIAKSYNISKNHLMKIVHQMGQAGIVTTVRGRNGGLKLAKSPEDISIGDVVRLMEPDFHIVECFNPESDSCQISNVCGLKSILNNALQSYYVELDNYTLADVIRPGASLRMALSLDDDLPSKAVN